MAAVPLGEVAEQSQSGGVLALSWPEPFHGKKSLDGTIDDLTSHSAVIILDLFDFGAGFAGRNAPLQTGIAVAAVAGKHFDTVESRDDAALHAIRIKDFVPLQRPVDAGEHPLQTFQMKTGETIAQHIISESAAGADPAL